MSESSDHSIPLVFIYLGNPLPSYALHSLRIARRHYQGPVILVTDQHVRELPLGVDRDDVSEWYDKDAFQTFLDHSPLDNMFAGGFWLLAAERLFVLEQFMRTHELEKVFHAELDVFISDLDGLASSLDEHGTGIFAPMDHPERALASLLYVNQVSALSQLVEYARDSVHLGDEMRILGTFIHDRPDIGHALPSDHVFAQLGWPYSRSTLSSQVGLVDAVGFGKWLFGLDPRMHQQSTWNHAANEKANPRLHSLRFSASPLGRKITVTSQNGERFRLRAIHVHAKIHRRLRWPLVISLHCLVANLPWRTPIVIQWRGWMGIVVDILLRPRSARILATASPALRHLPGKALGWLVTHSPRMLSNRQRARLIELLPAWPASLVARTPATPVPNLQSLPEDLRDTLAQLDTETRNSALQSIAILLDALNSPDDLVLYHHGDLARRALIDTGNHSGTFPLPVSADKDYQNVRHAMHYWGRTITNPRWSFSLPHQALRPEWVREMFPGGQEDIFTWARSGLQRTDPGLSAFQSYGLWVFSTKRSRTVLCQPLSA